MEPIKSHMESLVGLPGLLEETVSIDEIVKLGVNICVELEYRQKNHLPHCAVNPANIFFNTETGQYQLGDSGLSNLSESISVTPLESAASLFSAPETAEKGVTDRNDIRSKLYSLGLVMYMMLNNNMLPFIEKPGLRSAQEAQIRRLGGERLPLPLRSAENETLTGTVMKACEYAPEDRYESAPQMKAALDEIIGKIELKEAKDTDDKIKRDMRTAPAPHFPVLSDNTYQIEAEIGSGGGGIVYKAWHKRLKKHVVIKELNQGVANDLEAQRNEVEALKNVKSAYLPQVLDFLAEGGRVFTVMEFIEGESLDKLLEQGQKFTQVQVVRWYAQLASALGTIHKQNICHRDVKPANIMLTTDGNVCLIDFNAALVGGNDVRIISRSLGYASPEQYEIYEYFKKTRDGALPSDNQDAGFSPPVSSAGIEWKSSDIYSLGATMYHLLTNTRPPEKSAEVVPLSKLGRFGEGIVYIIEKSMQLDPAQRFSSGAVLSDAVSNIRKHDTLWKISRSKMIAAAIILPLVFIIFAGTALFGGRVMAQEKEERYYAAIHDIENSPDPQGAYESALDLFWDRIDPYRAMAERLWDDGDIDVCKSYIEQNLGNIAEFQAIPEAGRSFGDTYFILGNCYYYRQGEPDYNMACGSFEIAVRFVKDNPLYYRDYAVSLARTNSIAEAEQVLEIAQSLSLENDSLNYLKGEIAFGKLEYESAIDYFGLVISATKDDYLRYRAYHTSDEIFKLQGQAEESVALLEDALGRIPLNRVSEMTERLADAYAKNGDYENAIVMFERLSESGAPSFHIMQDLVILLHNAREYDRALAVLEQMSEIFPNDYRVPMRQAFLEADRQSAISSEDRDYSPTKHYYDSAVELYGTSNRPGGSDPEMQQLDLLIEQLRENNWIEGDR